MSTNHKSEEGPNVALKRESMNRLKGFLDMDPLVQLDNPLMTARTGILAKFLMLSDLHQRIKSVPGDIMEFGVWYGQTLVIMENLRAIHETFNFSRKFYGFDTFEGYYEDSGLFIKDEEKEKYNTGVNWTDKLHDLFDAHVKLNNSLSELDLIKGDVLKTIPEFFEGYKNYVALAYVDIATFETTKSVLDNVVNFVPRGGIIVIDDFGPQYPGVSEAMRSTNLDDFDIEVAEYYPSKLILTRR